MQRLCARLTTHARTRSPGCTSYSRTRWTGTCGALMRGFLPFIAAAAAHGRRSAWRLAAVAACEGVRRAVRAPRLRGVVAVAAILLVLDVTRSTSSV